MTRKSSETDFLIAERVREQRILRGLTQGELAEKVGVTFQQFQKYERGINRISAGRLYEIAQIMKVPVNYFFEGQGEGVDHNAYRASQLSLNADTLELIRLYCGIKDAATAHAIKSLIKAICHF